MHEPNKERRPNTTSSIKEFNKKDPTVISLHRMTNKDLIKLYNESKGFENIVFMIGAIKLILTEMKYESGYADENDNTYSFKFKTLETNITNY